MHSKPLPDGPNWAFDDLRAYMDIIGELATNDFQFNTYRNQIEIVSAEQMIDAYAFTGLPICYHHWRFGKYFSQWHGAYQKGHQGLAYELVINSDPCISYFMSENNLVTQGLVAAHACYGHNAFFKNNFLYQKWTHADAIVDYMIFARDFIRSCEEKHGYEKVEATLDACHALEQHGVDKYRRPSQLSAAAEKALQQKRIEERHKDVWHLWNTLPDPKVEKEEEQKFPPQPEENILYFLEKHSPILEDWQREIVRIVRKIAQYFYPQSQTKLSNEGYASFWHYEILYELWRQGWLTNGFMQSFLNLHTSVVNQPDYNKPGGLTLNYYYLTFHIYQDIKRICTEPTKEDEEWFPWLVGQNWVEQIHYAAYNFKDESFILQYLSPHIIRKMRLFALLDDSGQKHYDVTCISDADGYKQLRRILSHIYNRAYQIPDVQITDAKIKGDRRLTLRHTSVDDIPLEEKDKIKVMSHIKHLWGFEVQIFSDSKPKKPLTN